MGGAVILGETELLEIQERASLALDAIEDEAVRDRYARRAAEQDVPKLVMALRTAYAEGGGGGDLGLLLRNALKARIVKESGQLRDADKRIVTLAEDVRIHSMGVSAMAGEGRVFVDVRLAVGDEPVMK
jgi:hypothetical protein